MSAFPRGVDSIILQYVMDLVEDWMFDHDSINILFNMKLYELKEHNSVTFQCPGGVGRIISDYAICNRKDHESIHWLTSASLDDFKWFYYTFRIDRDWYLIYSIPGELCGSCGSEHLRFLVESLSLTKEEIMDNHIFELACEYMGANTAKWLHDRYSFTYEDFLEMDAFLDDVCMDDDLITAKWLVEIFKLNGELYDFKYAFEQVCSNGYLEMAQWMRQKFECGTFPNLGLAEILKSNIEHKNTDMCMWLINEFVKK